MAVPDGSSQPGSVVGERRFRLARLLIPAVTVVLIYCAWLLVPELLNLFWTSLPGSFRLGTVNALLGGMLLAYATDAAIVILGLLLLPLASGVWGRSIRRHRLAGKLLLLWASLAFSLVGLETGTAAWIRCLRRDPSLSAAPAESPRRDPQLPTQFAGETSSKAGTGRELRFLVIGESSARGEPFHPWLSVPQIAAWQLEKSLPGRNVRIEMWAVGGATLEPMYRKLEKLKTRPDVLIVFSGHNELYGKWPWSRNAPHYLDSLEVHQEPSVLDRAMRASPFCRLLLETQDQWRVGMLPPERITRTLVDWPLLTDKEKSGLLDAYERRVEAIAEYCDSLGTLSVFIIPACNDGGYEPSRSILPPTASAAERRDFAAEFLQVRAIEPDDTNRAIAGYRRLMARAPGFAETHFRLARLLERTSAWDEAREHYVQARELDAMPIRCPEAIRRIYRNVGQRHPGAILVDSARVLEQLSPHGILDDNVYLDAQHSTFRGYLALAQDLLVQLHERHAFGWADGRPPPQVSPDECARQFGLDADKWARVCQLSRGFYERTAFIRYDPTERLARAAAYVRAAELIRSGTPPEQAGITGLGVHPELAP
jgi:hypothetical protein